MPQAEILNTIWYPETTFLFARNFDAKFNWYADGIFDDAFDEIKKL